MSYCEVSRSIISKPALALPLYAVGELVFLLPDGYLYLYFNQIFVSGEKIDDAV